jgi:hypothetical protein
MSDPTLTITVDGRPLAVAAGTTVAVALLNHGAAACPLTLATGVRSICVRTGRRLVLPTGRQGWTNGRRAGWIVP